MWHVDSGCQVPAVGYIYHPKDEQELLALLCPTGQQTRCATSVLSTSQPVLGDYRQ